MKMKEQSNGDKQSRINLSNSASSIKKKTPSYLKKVPLKKTFIKENNSETNIESNSNIQ